MSFIAKQSNGHKCLIYADNIVIYANNYYLNAAIEALYNALDTLNSPIDDSFLCIALEKCKAMVFTIRRYYQ